MLKDQLTPEELIAKAGWYAMQGTGHLRTAGIFQATKPDLALFGYELAVKAYQKQEELLTQALELEFGPFKPLQDNFCHNLWDLG